MNNEQKAIMIADQCKPCSNDFYLGIKQGVKIALDAENSIEAVTERNLNVIGSFVEYLQEQDISVSEKVMIGFFESSTPTVGCPTDASKVCRSFTVYDLEILSGTISIPSLTIDLVDVDFAANIERKLEEKGYSIDYVSLDDMGHISVGYYGKPYPVTITDKHIEDLLSVLNDR